jgi:hypothetical protein
MQQNAGLFSQHVSSIIMPIFRSTLVCTAFWCPNLENMNSEVWSTSGQNLTIHILLHLVGYLFYIIYDARSDEHPK